MHQYMHYTYNNNTEHHILYNIVTHGVGTTGQPFDTWGVLGTMIEPGKGRARLQPV